MSYNYGRLYLAIKFDLLVTLHCQIHVNLIDVYSSKKDHKYGIHILPLGTNEGNVVNYYSGKF